MPLHAPHAQQAHLSGMLSRMQHTSQYITLAYCMLALNLGRHEERAEALPSFQSMRY